MTSAVAKQWDQITRAMAEQVDRVNRKAADPEATAQIRHLMAENARLVERLTDAQRLIDDLKAQLDDTPRPVRTRQQRGSLIDPATGRPVGTQSEFARLNRVKPYQVSRWIAANKIQTTGKYVFLDQSAPTRSR